MSGYLKIAIALTLGVFCCLKEIQTFSDELNRFYHNWTVRDSAALLVGPVILATLFLAFHFLARKWRFAKNFETATIVFIVAQALVTYFWPRTISMNGKLMVLISVWLVISLIMLYAFRKPQVILFKLLRESMLIFSPFVVILVVTVFNWSTWPSPIDPIPQTGVSDGDEHPVMIFLFDAWSARRSVDREGEFLPELKNINQLVRTSSVYRQARSAYHGTFPSIPNSLYLVDDSFDEARERYLGENPRSPEENLFGIARKAGYAAYLVGFKIPYRNILGNCGGTVRSYSFDPNPQGIAGKIGCYLRNNLLFSKNPLSMVAKTYSYRRILSKQWLYLNETTLKDTSDIIETSPSNSLSIFHLPLPHAPFIFDGQGNYKGPLEGHEPMGKSLDAYREHLVYLDTVIGRLIAKIKASGKYDDALIIMSADHSWREDNYQGSVKEIHRQVREVPLIIKYPRQTEGVTIDSPVNVLTISKLLKESLESGQGNRIDFERLTVED